MPEKIEELNSRISPGAGSGVGGTISSPVGMIPTTGFFRTNTSVTPAAIIAPIAAVIPPAATSSALIYVGILMASNLRKIDFSDMTQLLPVAVMLLAMPVSGSIGHGIGLALICYAAIMCCTGRAKQVSALTYVLCAIFLVKFFLPM